MLMCIPQTRYQRFPLAVNDPGFRRRLYRRGGANLGDDSLIHNNGFVFNEVRAIHKAAHMGEGQRPGGSRCQLL
jgi:hypothetical protein